jgi:prolyl oligopeptidase
MTGLSYPTTPTGDVVDDYHGTQVADPYRWLEDTDAPETAAWIAEQNRLSRAWLDGVAAREPMRRRLLELWDHPRVSTPSHRAGRWFQLRNSGLQDQDVLYVMDAPGDEGRVLLDPNTMSDDGTVALAAVVGSHDARLLAYALSEAGSDWMTWRVRDVASGEDLPDVVRWGKFSAVAWLPDGSGFFYCGYSKPADGEAYEAENRNHRLWLHRLGTSQDGDRLVYERTDQPGWVFSVATSEDGRYVLLTVSEGTERTNRLFYLDLAGGVDGEFVELLSEADAAYGYVANDGPVLYVLTDLDAERGRLVAIDTREPGREHWREVVGEHPEDTLQRALLLGMGSAEPGGRLLLGYLHRARARLARFTLEGQPDGEVELPGIGMIAAVTGRMQDTAVYFDFMTFTSPRAIYRHDLATGETVLVQPSALDGDEGEFVTEQVLITSRDGTDVPVFLVRRADVEPTGDVPVLLYGYGGFQIPVTPAFSAWWRVWIEMGGLLAVANLRGGGEYGTAWHDAGRLEHKQNVFDDCVAVAKGLVARGWTRPGRIALNGGSNGGLLVGACMVQRPDLFGACVPEVGVLDMLRFHKFTIGWAWVSDYGSADDPEQFRRLYAYSPLHNLRPGERYPATLVVTGDHDDRVVPGHSFKFTAALQAAVTADGRGFDPERPALARIQTQAGHGAGKPTRFQVEERADVLAFLVRALGFSPSFASE